MMLVSGAPPSIAGQLAGSSGSSRYEDIQRHTLGSAGGDTCDGDEGLTHALPHTLALSCLPSPKT